MARYNTFQYGDPVYYGAASASVYEALPFSAEALDYDKVKVSWVTPGMAASTFEYTRLRVVRNQDYPSETQEDGIVIVDLFEPFNAGNYARVVDGTITGPDGSLLPALRPGKYVYYSIWLLKKENSGANIFWDKIADTSMLLASSHDTLLGNTDDSLEILSLQSTTRARTMTTHQKMLDLLPKVYTTATENPLDIVNEDSDLSLFLKGFSYTLDEIYTYADLLLPSRDATNYSPDLLRAKSFELSLQPDNQSSPKIQQKLVREAFYMFSRKGTSAALQTFAECETGFDTLVTTSPNLMLSTQDSTFYKGIGGWKSIGGCTLTSVKTETVPAIDSDTSKAIDRVYCGQVVTAAANSQITSLASSSVTRGIPVKKSTSHTFSAYVKNTSSGTVTPTIRWYDVNGTFISSSTTTAWTTSSSWAKRTLTATSPSTAVYASVELKFNSASQTYLIDMVQFAEGSAAAFEEARAAQVYLYPTKVNHIVNPSFETNKSSWTITDSGSSTVSDSPVDVISGGKSLSATISSSQKIETVVFSGSNELAISTGVYYTFSFYAKKSTAGTVNATATLQAVSGALNSQNNVAIAITNTWKRYEVNLFIPATYSAPTLTATLIGVDSGVVLFDAAQLERAYSATDYFDGSMSINGGEWSGTANASASYMFPNKSKVLSRLAIEMPSFLVSGTPYRVVNASGIVSGNMGELKGFAP